MNCVIEFYASGEERPAAILYQQGNASLEGEKGNIGIHGRIQLLEMLLNTISGGSRLADPEWAAAEYVSLFRSLGQGHISVVQKRKPDAQMLYKIYCTPNALRVTVYHQSGSGLEFKKAS